MHFKPPRIALAVLLPAVLLLGGCAAIEPSSTASNSDSPTNQEWLLTADPKERALYVNDVSDGKQTGSIGDIQLGVHAGSIQLGKGRIAFVDESGPRLTVLQVDNQGKPRIE